MSKSNKILLAALTVWPVIYVPIFFGFLISMMTGFGSHVNVPTGPPIALFVMHGMTILLALGLTIFYMVNVFTNGRLKVKESERVLWAVIVLFGGSIGQAAYWYVHIWSE